MGTSRIPGPHGVNPHSQPEDLRSALGIHEQAHRDTPGSLGVNDWADFLASWNTNAARPAYLPTLATQAASASASQCACGRDITLDELCAVFSRQRRSVGEKYLPLLNSTFGAYDITSCLRKAHFLAQVGHESGELKYTAEGLKKGVTESKVYDGYKGRGLIQLTWSRNYRAYGKFVHHSFLGEHKSELEKPEWATDSAGWYWVYGTQESLNDLADDNDLLAITTIVNGGFNGFDDRRRHLAAAQASLRVRECKKAGIGVETFRAFPKSQIYSSAVRSFAWGYWNDLKGNKSGVMRSAESRKEGYRRYLELTQTKPLAKTHGKDPTVTKHFGLTVEQMNALATEGAK